MARDPERVVRKKADMDLQSMPVDIQEHILLQLDSPISLLRASSTCKLWRRLIAGTVFLQRFRSLHRPPVVGYYHNTNHLLRPVPIFKPVPPVTTTIASRYEPFDLFLPLEWLWMWGQGQPRKPAPSGDCYSGRQHAFQRPPPSFLSPPAGDGEARVVFLAGDKLNIFARPKGRSGDWMLEKSVPQPSAVRLGVPSAQRFSLGLSMPSSADTKMGMVKLIASSGQMKKLAAFNLNIEKKQLKRTEYEKAYPIRLPWPPSLHACSAGGEI
ncbi:hypothetical protein PR202_ga04541 [Eleusine coracana subsp. coracana]|uniref:F-box domain-containing protein n=1 Tax=Eleusine coracana subsp. coracana TaxID=191504 RepID=A0AAV5BSA6_ELECO|nr:hypothetical protein PR202_ga04541 [Eleusine coracana subsp. coracana]